ncbi:hypothetical protein R1sor_017707 [Riccia sorocarpa]|uniref:Globin domain-containing protein n=1 Tax=Riccia sorocarpa TaxID=122646 RepID=A0ABD3IB65_9MARC
MAAETQTFTKAQAQIVKETWELYKKDSAGNGLLFFSKIFELEPEMRDFFPFTQDHSLPLEKNYKLKAHALLLFKLTVDGAVALGETGTMHALHPKLTELGKKHVGFGVILDHFTVVKTALLHTIKTAVSRFWTPEKTEEAVNAWSLAYDELVTVMQAKMEATRKAAATAWASDD